MPSSTSVPVDSAQPEAPRPANAMDRFFRISERGSSVYREVRGGFATFFAMAYIIVLNPIILGSGVDKFGHHLDNGQLVTATVLTAALTTLLMGVIGNVPIALAAGLGINSVVALQLAPRMSWADAMGMVVLAGIAIMLLVATGLRERVMSAVPLGLRKAIAIGIGLFIFLIGLVDSGFVSRIPDAAHTTVPLQLGDGRPSAGLAGPGVHPRLAADPRADRPEGARRDPDQHRGDDRARPGARRGGQDPGRLLGSDGAALARRPGRPAGLRAARARPVCSAASPRSASSPASCSSSPCCCPCFFDAMGTILGVTDEAGLLDDRGNLPGINRVLFVDGVATALGGASSSSSNTCFVESTAGVGEGARTGLASVVTGLLFVVALFLTPLATMVPAQAATPALVAVGFLIMANGIRQIDWSDYTIAVAGVPDHADDAVHLLDHQRHRHRLPELLCAAAGGRAWARGAGRSLRGRGGLRLLLPDARAPADLT